MLFRRTKLHYVIGLGVIANLQLLSSCASETGTDLPFKKQPSMLQSGTTVNDVLSKRVMAESYFEGNQTVAVALLGDRVVHEYQDGRAREIGYFDREEQRPGVNTSSTCVWVLMDSFNHFKKQKEIVGQANLTLQVNANQTCEIVTETLYLPGCEPYVGGSPGNPQLQEFLQQIKSSISAIESKHLQLPTPEHRSITFEIVIGRDPSQFPRYATPFNGMMIRDAGGIRHTKAFVRDGAE